MEVRVVPTWDETVAYFESIGFMVRPQVIGSMMRRCQPCTSRVTFARQYVQRGGHPGRHCWRALFETETGVTDYCTPWFDTPEAAFVYAEIDNWGRPI